MTLAQPDALQKWGDYDLDDPFPLFADVLGAGPVHDVVLKDGVRAFLVVTYDAAREALNHADLSKDMETAIDAASDDGDVVSEGLPGRDFARHMLSVDPPDHARLRGLATPGFTKSRLSGLEGRITATVDSLLDDLAAGDGPVDLVEGFALPLPFSVIGELLGIDADGQESLVAWFATLMAPYSGSTPPPEAVAASDGIVGYLNDLVDQRLATPTEDLVGDLARSANAGAITRKELLSSLFQLIVAGHHTTTSLIGNGVAALLQHPDQLAVLVADPTLVPKAVEEFLRYRRAGPPLDLPLREERRRHRRHHHPRRRPGHREPRRRRPRPGQARRPGRARRPPRVDRPPRVRPRHPPLPRRAPGEAGGGHRLPCPARALPGHQARGRPVRAALEPRRRARPPRAVVAARTAALTAGRRL